MGPALVCLVEPRETVYWIAHGTQMLRVAHVHLRPEFAEERPERRLVVDTVKKVRDTLESLHGGLHRYVDLRGANGEGPELSGSDAPMEDDEERAPAAAAAAPAPAPPPEPEVIEIDSPAQAAEPSTKRPRAEQDFGQRDFGREFEQAADTAGQKEPAATADQTKERPADDEAMREARLAAAAAANRLDGLPAQAHRAPAPTDDSTPPEAWNVLVPLSDDNLLVDDVAYSLYEDAYIARASGTLAEHRMTTEQRR